MQILDLTLYVQFELGKKWKQKNSAFEILTRSRQLCHLWPSLGSNSTTPLSNQKLINHCKRRNVHLLLVFVAIYFFFVFIILKLYQAKCLSFITTIIKKIINLEKSISKKYILQKLTQSCSVSRETTDVTVTRGIHTLVRQSMITVALLHKFVYEFRGKITWIEQLWTYLYSRKSIQRNCRCK